MTCQGDRNDEVGLRDLGSSICIFNPWTILSMGSLEKLKLNGGGKREYSVSEEQQDRDCGLA